MSVTVYPSVLAFLLAVGPYVADKGRLTLWLSQEGGVRTEFFGLQVKDNPQVVFAITRDHLLRDLGVALYTSKTVQRARADGWLRTVELAVSDPTTGDYYYNLLIGQASSRTTLEGGSSLSATLARKRSLGAALTGGSALYADITVTP